jgi:DNA-binding CsgD family transcriptional regulator
MPEGAIGAGLETSLARHLGTSGANENSFRSSPALTQREAEVLALLASGKSNSDIASQLSVTEPIIKEHVRSVLLKAMAKTRPHLAPVPEPREIKTATTAIIG